MSNQVIKQLQPLLQLVILSKRPFSSGEAYRGIWNEVCEDRGVACEPDVIDFAINELHKANRTALLPCHPRDLINIALDHTVYSGSPRQISKEHVARAWDAYFVSLKSDHEQS